MKKNAENHMDPKAASITFSQDAGIYNKGFRLKMTTGADLTIHYTTDGSVPTESDRVYKRPIRIKDNTGRSLSLFTQENIRKMFVDVSGYGTFPEKKTKQATVIRAAAFDSQGNRGEVFTKTYFIGHDKIENDLPLLSITTDPDNLLNYDSGIMVTGACYDVWKETPEAMDVISNSEWWNLSGNYTQKGKEWERPASIEFFDGENRFSADAGIRLHGSLSRMYGQKGFSIYFRKRYGTGSLEYELFPDARLCTGETLRSYKSFIIRNGGNDAEYLKYKDAAIQALVRNADLAMETQTTRPVILYLNGEYYGIETVISKYSDDYIAAKYGIDKDSIVIIKENQIAEGKDEDIALYDYLNSFAEKDMSDDHIWSDFQKIMDVHSMADYFAAEIYIGNADWAPDKNVELWRTRESTGESGMSDGKWRYMLFDTEYSSSLYNHEVTASGYDSYAAALEIHPLFNSAMKNLEFAGMFRESLKKMCDDVFTAEKVAAVFASFDSLYKPVLPEYYKHFGLYLNRFGIPKMAVYEGNLSNTKTFFLERPAALKRLHPELS